MHRKDYIGVEHTSREQAAKLHRRYYGQFVDDRVRALVQGHFGLARLVESTDPHFNDIPLSAWDRLAGSLPWDTDKRLREQGDCLSPMAATCILKEAARQLVRHP